MAFPSGEQSLNVALSLLLHVFVLAGAMGAPLWGGTPVRPLPVTYDVRLVTLPSPTPPAASATRPAEKSPVPASPPVGKSAPTAPRVVAPAPPPVPEEVLTLPGRRLARRESAPPAAPAPPARSRQPIPAPPSAAPPAIVPTPFAAPGAPVARAAPTARVPAPGEGTDVEAMAASADPAAATYTAIVSEHVRRLWEPPGDGQAVIHARVLRSRFVRDVAVVRPSGNPLFDMSAVRAIQEGVPYPPFPALMREEHVDLAFTFTGKEVLR